jgi:hypothetical protein
MQNIQKYEKERVNIIGHIVNLAYQDNLRTIFAIETSQFLEVKDLIKL